MLKPKKLSAGDKIAVVAPASAFPREQFESGVAELQRLGFETVFEPSVFDAKSYLAGEPATRAAAFLKAWRDPSVRAIVAVRGGYGSVHVLPFLDAKELRRDPKAFIGYSDLTSLLSYLTTQCGIVSFHGPMLDRRLGNGTTAYDADSFLRSLTSTEPLGEMSAPNLECLRTGEAVGPIAGGTLAQIVASLGTPYAFSPPDGHVLFLEDINERPYRLDRMMTQLRLAGILANAAAVVLGEFVGCDEASGEPSARATLAGLLSDFPGPVVYGFPSGHTAGALVTLPFGVRSRVIGAVAPRVIIEESGVS